MTKLRLHATPHHISRCGQMLAVAGGASCKRGPHRRLLLRVVVRPARCCCRRGAWRWLSWCASRSWGRRQSSCITTTPAMTWKASSCKRLLLLLELAAQGEGRSLQLGHGCEVLQCGRAGQSLLGSPSPGGRETFASCFLTPSVLTQSSSSSSMVIKSTSRQSVAMPVLCFAMLCSPPPTLEQICLSRPACLPIVSHRNCPPISDLTHLLAASRH